MELSNWFVVAMGIGTVFVGLICIIICCKIMSICCNILSKVDGNSNDTKSVAAAPVAAPQPVIENRQEILAAVCAVCAEELGTDISAIRVVSFKKI